MRSASLLRRVALLFLALAAATALIPTADAQTAGRRVALIVGNGAYRSVDRLANPGNDARLMARTLEGAGFTLVGGGPQLDLDKGRFDRLVRDFGRAVQGADVALFYYSGHGMQVGGVNWLVPVDASPTGARDLDFMAVDAGLVLRQMEGAGTRLNIVVLDACRNNPFASRGVRASAGGLAEMRAPEGTLISYATQPGNVAADGAAGNSPYTAALAEAIKRPGLDVFQVFNQVGLMVKAATGGQQQPWVATSPISGTFNFYGPVTVMPSAQPPGEEAVFWQSVANSRNPGDFQAYLRRYPNGAFADLARERLRAVLAAAGTPRSANLRFDGTWAITLQCGGGPDGVRGFTRRIAGTVQDGVLRAEAGVREQPDHMTWEGTIQPDGSITILVRGLTGNAAFTLGRSAPGTPYAYRMLGRFEERTATATRLAGRECSASLSRV